MNLSMFIELGKYHFYIMSERVLFIGRITFKQKIPSPENGMVSAEL